MSTLNTKLNVGVNGDVTHELGFQRSSDSGNSGRSITGHSPTYGKIPSITLKTDKKLSFACLACQTKMQNGFYPVVFLHFSY